MYECEFWNLNIWKDNNNTVKTGRGKHNIGQPGENVLQVVKNKRMELR